MRGMAENPARAKPLFWVGSSKRQYREFPGRVQDNPGFELYPAQTGQHPPSAKPLKGFDSGVLELIEDFDGNTYRAVYAVRFGGAVYVLHAFQKKSRHGIATPKSEIDLIRRRLRDAELHHLGWSREEKR
jgi:phage-related protein